MLMMVYARFSLTRRKAKTKQNEQLERGVEFFHNIPSKKKAWVAQAKVNFLRAQGQVLSTKPVFYEDLFFFILKWPSSKRTSDKNIEGRRGGLCMFNGFIIRPL